ncbi:hypothetical protein [Cupriavidus sp.]|uniref:hypothetical protein n=1 Tax=Cupriavidus sp. TaxID=1873897 RepID=UPI0031DAF1EA
MTDLRHVHTGLSAEDRHLAILESRRLQQIRELGDRYLLAPSNAPERGTYHMTTGLRLA